MILPCIVFSFYIYVASILRLDCGRLLNKTGQNCETVAVACVAGVSVWFRSKEKPGNGILGFGRVRNETSQKNESGGRGKGRKETPLPALLVAQFFARVLDSRSLLINRTETLATQATVAAVLGVCPPFCFH